MEDQPRMQLTKEGFWYKPAASLASAVVLRNEECIEASSVPADFVRFLTRLMGFDHRQLFRQSQAGTMQEENQRLRVLCLHGIGTNSDIFEAQTATLLRLLGPHFDYEFVDGSYPWPADASVKEAFGDEFIGLSYLDGTASSVKAALSELQEFVQENGPFDLVLGRSIGASLAATLLISQAKQQALFKCAVFLNGLPPLSWTKSGKERLSFLEPGQSEEVIRIPTIHAYGTNDEEYPGSSARLVAFCDSTDRQVILHDKGHRVPTEHDKCKEIAKAVRRAIAG